MIDPVHPRRRMPGWRGEEGPTSVDIADAASAVADFDWLVLDSRGAGDTGAHGCSRRWRSGCRGILLACLRIAMAFSHFPSRGAENWRRARLPRRLRSSRPQYRPSSRPSQLSFLRLLLDWPNCFEGPLINWILVGVDRPCPRRRPEGD
jgi:hypothetical protein